MKTITAEEARILVKECNSNAMINKILDKIYSKIHLCACNGISRTEMFLEPIALKYKEDICSILVKEGYKVGFKTIVNVRECDEYVIKISWENA